jgi:hypothetical protein
MFKTPLDGIPLFSSKQQAGEQRSRILMGKLARHQTGETKANIHILGGGHINAMIIQSLPPPNPLLSSWPPSVVISSPETIPNGINSTIYLLLWATLPMEVQLVIGRNATATAILGKKVLL